MNIRILYEDNHLLVIEKPVNIPVQADDSHDQDLITILKEDLKIRYNKPGNVYLGLVHRLDRPVGGAMVFAKTSKAASRLSDLIRTGDIERGYVAIVRGQVVRKFDRLEHYLLKDTKKNKVSVVSAKNKNGKKAILDYELIQVKQELSKVAVRLQTGRSHQIRVQFQTIGHPLYGDQKYGVKVNKPGQQIALWANHLAFKHPTKDERIEISCEQPNEYPWNEFV